MVLSFVHIILVTDWPWNYCCVTRNVLRGAGAKQGAPFDGKAFEQEKRRVVQMSAVVERPNAYLFAMIFERNEKIIVAKEGNRYLFGF